MAEVGLLPFDFRVCRAKRKTQLACNTSYSLFIRPTDHPGEPNATIPGRSQPARVLMPAQRRLYPHSPLRSSSCPRRLDEAGYSQLASAGP
jgi:hypothetical protein